MQNISKELIKTYNELSETIKIMRDDKGVTPTIFSKILDTRSSIHNIIMNSLDNLNSKETKKILNQIIRK
jgi:hypothetical protein